MLVAWLCLVFITGICSGAASSDGGSVAVANSSDGQTREYNLQRLILPIAGDRYLGVDPELWSCEEYSPCGTFHWLWSQRFDFKLSGSEVERLGRFTHPRWFATRMQHQLDLPFHIRFPKLVRTMKFLADNGLLAFDEGFYTVAAAVLRANYLYVRDKAVAMRRSESMPVLPANFNDPDAPFDGLDTLPDSAMIGYFYNHFKVNPPKTWDDLHSKHAQLPSNDLLKNAETMQEALRPINRYGV